MGERAGRSVALERAYVHEVYEQHHEQLQQHQHHHQAAPWPRAAAFLAALEPGSLVCDVGCGNGKYLNINPSVFTVGGDRCQRLTEIAREKDNQVVLCDNLALPFRDESFDAVVSMAVVHHFATAERRARALRELARVLRIGGRLIISVWAMEQRNRKFESQDVLVPWHRPDTLSTPSLDMNSNTTTSEDDLMQPAYHAYTQTSDSDSYRGNQTKKKNRTRNKGRSIDPMRPMSTSPSTSSLSSPNETCYSFVRRAIQKLAGGKRSVKPWFLETWGSYSKENSEARYDPDGCEDYDAEIHDLPIELRRLEEEEVPLRRQTFTCSETSTYNELCMAHKSKSLSDILAAQQLSDMVRSRSSVPSLGCIVTELEQTQAKEEKVEKVQKPSSKPKLVKQKKSINEKDEEEDLDKPTDMKNLVNQLPDFKVSSLCASKRACVLKQTSLNEELMSTDRLREKEKVRKNIQKQASLNEDYLYRRHKKLDSLRDSFFSTSATTAKKFQSLKNGLTHKIKSSTTHIEKATVNSFVRILQGWKSQENPSTACQNQNETVPPNTPPADNKSLGSGSDETKPHSERRHSKEDGSDSSKDSSLQSDTSVDSEDSFASVIFIPKSDANGLQDPLSPTPLSPGPTSPRMKVSSVPTSPRVKNAPGGLPSPRLKQLPLTIFPIVRPPGSPKSCQPPVQINKVLTNQINVKSQPPIKEQDTPPTSLPTSPSKGDIVRTHIPELCSPSFNRKVTDKLRESIPFEILSEENDKMPTEEEIASQSQELMKEISKEVEEINKLTAETNNIRPRVLQDTKPYPKITLQTVAELPEIPHYKGKKEEETNLSSENLNARLIDRKRRERLKQIRDLLRQRPGFVSTNSRTIFPIVRRCSTQEGKVEPPVKPLPRLLSLELFNPETDDVDSDSSGVSSPDSVDSVINVVPEEQKPKPIKEKENPTIIPTVICEPEADEPKIRSSPSSHSLLEAAAEVAQSLEETCEAVIQSSPRCKRKQLESMESTEAMALIHGSSESSSGSNWSLNKLSPGDLRLLEDRSRSHSHTSSSGSTSSLERLSPGRRSKERSPKQGSTSNSTWSLNKLSPIKHEGRSFEDSFSKCRRSPTKFPYDSMSSLEADKNLIKSDSFSRLQANERLVTCKSDMVVTSEEEEKQWNNECKHHLTEFAEKLSEKLLQEIDQYSKRISEEDFEIGTKPPSDSKCKKSATKPSKEPTAVAWKKIDNVSKPSAVKNISETNDLNKSTTSLQEQNKFVATMKDPHLKSKDLVNAKCACKNKNLILTSSKNSEVLDNNVNKDIDLSKRNKTFGLRKSLNSGKTNLDNLINNNIKCNSDVPNKLNCNESSTSSGEPDFIVPVVNISDSTNGNPEITIETEEAREARNQSLESGYSLESEISIDSFCTDKRSSLKVGQSTDSSEVDKMEISPESLTSRSSASTAPLKPGFSVDSSDAGDISGSGSDWSRRDTNSASKIECGSTASLGCASTASLASCSDWSKERKLADGRSSSEETAPTRSPLIRQKAEDVGKPNEQRSLQASLSDTSQDSLPSDNGGGAITFHRYYHVFKEGELDQLIEKYVENLHIISSYYDHASWCIIAEKVQVWTI